LETDTTEVVPRLVSLDAYRCLANCEGSGSEPIQLDRSSRVTLTDQVQNGNLTWTAPDGSTWVLVASWQRGTAQVPAMYYFPVPHSSVTPGGLPYVVNHLSRAGAEAVIDYWDAHLLSPRIRSLLRQTGGAIFEDSLELRHSVLWTREFLAQFRSDHGYSLRPYLPLLYTNSTGGGPGMPPTTTPVFTFPDDITSRVEFDYQQTLSKLYINNRLKPLTAWAHSLGLEFRVQPYGEPVDSALAAATVDIPEGESLGFSDLDSFRLLAGGRDLGGRRLLSDEAGAFFNGAYNTTWERMLTTINANYAAGVNQAVLHGFAYATAPGATWPGFAPFSPFIGGPGFAEAWGPRQPTWAHVDQVSGYLARAQVALQTGKNKVDVAVYHQEGNASDGAPFFSDPGLAQAGYSYNFVSPGTLQLSTARVRDGILAPGGPAYRALVLNDQRTLTLAVARRLVRYARAGLAIIVVGSTPTSTPGYTDPAREDGELRRLIAELLTQPTVRMVPTEADVPAALSAMSVSPAVNPSQATAMLNVHRAEPGVDYYFLENNGDTAITQSVTLAGSGIPYLLDPWTGKVTPIAEYRGSGDRVTLEVSIVPGDSAIIAVASRSWSGKRAATVHAITSEADAVVARGGKLVIRDNESGTYRTVLSNGGTVSGTIGAVPNQVTPAAWRLKVDDWRPGATATETVHVRHVLELTELRPWSEIPELQDVSGIGTYTTTVTLPSSWNRRLGADLDLGSVFDTFRITVNGRTIPAVNQMRPSVDVGRYLVAGENTIQVQVATTLNNRLRIEQPTVFGSQPRQDYGLLGPVTLTPYGQTTIWPPSHGGS
jgi:hypothetical protein